MKLSVIITNILVILLSTGCGELKSSTENKVAENRSTMEIIKSANVEHEVVRNDGHYTIVNIGSDRAKLMTIMGIDQEQGFGAVYEGQNLNFGLNDDDGDGIIDTVIIAQSDPYVIIDKLAVVNLPGEPLVVVPVSEVEIGRDQEASDSIEDMMQPLIDAAQQVDATGPASAGP